MTEKKVTATATKMGFYNGKRIRPGQQFSVKEGIKGKWFTTGETKPEAEPAKRGRKPAVETLNEPDPKAAPAE